MIDKLAAWRAEEQAPFSGWDFSHIHDRWTEEHPPWSYEDLAREALYGARSAVDLGTGGGERLSTLADVFPKRMFATEAYPPNAKIARARGAADRVNIVCSMGPFTWTSQAGSCSHPS